MPSWNIHLAVAKEVNKKLKLNKNSFYFGNTVPDVDYGMKAIRKETHFYNTICKKCPSEKLPDIKRFLSMYKNKLDNPLIMGTLVHILTDYYYNNEIFTKHWIQDEKHNVVGIKLKNNKIKFISPDDNETKKFYKHHDLELYGKYLFNKGLIEFPIKDNKIFKDALDLKDNLYEKEDIARRLKYLNEEYIYKNKYTLKEKIFGLNYKMIDKVEQDKLFANCVSYILNEIVNIKK